MSLSRTLIMQNHTLATLQYATETGAAANQAAANKVAKYNELELCADELVVGGGVGWSYDRRRRRAARFSSAAAA